MSLPKKPLSAYHAKLHAAHRRGTLAGVLGILYSLGLIVTSLRTDPGLINFGLPLYVLLALPVTMVIWFIGEIFERVYWLAQLLTTALLVGGTYYLWTYPV